MSTTTWIAVTTIAGVAVGAGTAWYVGRRKPANGPAPTPSPIVDGWSIRTAHDPGYPWNELVLHAQNWPTPGMFVDAGDHTGEWHPSNGFDSLVRALLGSALAMAGNDPTIADAEGKDPQASLARSLRTAVRKSLIEPGGWNDRVYGQTNANYAGGIDPGKPCTKGSVGAPCNDGIRDPNANPVRYMMNAEGRGLNWYPRHANNLERMGNKQPAMRTTTLGGQVLPNVKAGHQMVIYAPAYDLSKLAPDQATPTIAYLTWPDGTSTVNPPPAVMALGIDTNGIDLSGVELGAEEGA